MLKNFIAFLGRFCLSLIFIASAVSKIVNWQGSEQLVLEHLTNLSTYGLGISWLQQLIELVTPMVPALLIAAVFCELVGGLCLLLGLQVRFGAFLLIVFLIPTTLLMHHFWFLQEPARGLETVMFLKNLSILGGLLVVLAFGKGRGIASCPDKKESPKS